MVATIGIINPTNGKHVCHKVVSPFDELSLKCGVWYSGGERLYQRSSCLRRCGARGAVVPGTTLVLHSCVWPQVL